MPFPAGTYINQIVDPAVRAEFEQLYSLYFGYLSQEHKDDGSHGAITADSATVTGDGTFDGNVTADADGGPVEVGAFAAPSAIMSRAVNGIDLRVSTTGASASRWRIGASDGGSNFRDLLFQDLVGALSPYTFRVFWDGTEYALEPNGPLSLLRLGSNATSTRLTSVDAGFVRALDGYLERGRTVKAGEWTTPAYNAANFTASAGTWTVDSGDVTTYAYTLVGKTMTVMFAISTTDVSAAPAQLLIAIPGGFTAAKATRNPINVIDAGAAAALGFAIVQAAGTNIILVSNAAGGGWTTTAADNTHVFGQITFEIQ